MLSQYMFQENGTEQYIDDGEYDQIQGGNGAEVVYTNVSVVIIFYLVTNAAAHLAA